MSLFMITQGGVFIGASYEKNAHFAENIIITIE